MKSPLLNKLSKNFRSRPPFNWLLFCLVSVLVVIALLGSSSSAFNSVTSFVKDDVYTNYRKLKEQARSNYLELKSLYVGENQLKDVGVCGKERENYVPFYNVSANILAGFKDGEELDRHCELSCEHQHCMIRPPKDYKIPLSWPAGRDVIWSGNVKLTKDQFLSSGSITKRLMLLEENQIAFHSQDGMIVDDVKDYSHQIAEMIGLRSDTESLQAGVRTVLDIGCGFGSFSAHLLSLNLMALCVAAYGSSGSQVQIPLERGLPAVIGNFISKQLPFPSLSYDIIHCAQCGVIWDSKDRLFLIELMVYSSLEVTLFRPHRQPGSRVVLPVQRREAFLPLWKSSRRSSVGLFWNSKKKLSSGRRRLICCATHLGKTNEEANGTIPICKGQDMQLYYQPLAHCISGTGSDRWVPIHRRSDSMNSTELKVHGIHPDNFFEDLVFWKSAVRNYWSLLSPLIFSDHPKRPGDDDPLPPYNMVRNVLDMNAHYAALLEARRSVWVMNAVPLGMHNTLPMILDRGFADVLHN